MIDAIITYKERLIIALLETLDMVLVSSLISIIFGISLGLLLFLFRKNSIYQNKLLYSVISVISNIIRSIPFILFIIVLIPFNRLIIGTGFGVNASKIPLSLIGIASLSRLAEQTFIKLDNNLYETSYTMGSSKKNYIKYFLLNEARGQLVLNITTTIISIIAYSTVVGTIGGGGLGYLAINEGFSNFQYNLMWVIIIIMIIIVSVIQTGGNLIARKIDKR
ncbi:ABC transporter permease subunit [Haploplasma modicum]|uniref:ABC transporter permease subunit n=1 Tax=Haploplasma modicum TaxID=2150 RepID=UPI000478E541|nr:ABC transporter permease subunit [Haploplasma modicum]